METNILVIWLVASFAMPLINLIKAKMKLKGKQAFYLYAGLSAVISLLVILTDGGFGAVTFESFAGVLGQFMAFTTVVYKMILEKADNA